MSFARRMAAIEPFLAVEVAERAQVLERDGADIVHLEYGEPDFEAPAVIRDALDRAIKDGRMRYTHSLGIPPLREAIAEHYTATYGVTISPEQILVTPGTSPAMLLLFGHLLDAGDEVVLSNPYYACYPNFIRYADGVPAYVDVMEADGFQYRPEAIRARLTGRTRAILINSPANPTGAVLSAERLDAIADLARDGGPMIVSDEIYHGLSEGARDRSILEFTDRAFVLNGFSKAFAMTGWRLGYVIAPREHVRAMQTLFGNFFISTNEFVQWAGVAALREAADETRHFARIFAERRRAMVAGLRALGFGVATEPAGAFYVLANARRWTMDSRRFAYDVLEQSHVAVTPGAAFGSNAEGYLRFSYTASIERIREGLRRLAPFLAGR
ncbi:MAG TPA: pyridoxal phosphate-dependent aminotransferase [Methylomirabilota bacterium]|jgi:aspartate/methionine/tyrosine aminotransferase|nr:pyridoxal phosphate-dependent aminotransferase [Methylomirabilota bacterium]